MFDDPASMIRCEAALQRIEVFLVEGGVDECEWAITRIPPTWVPNDHEDPDTDWRCVAGTVGHLSIRDAGGLWGQAIVFGQVMALTPDQNPGALARVTSLDSASDEMIYDVARRALQSNASHMDRRFTLPIKAPEPLLQEALSIESPSEDGTAAERGPDRGE